MRWCFLFYWKLLNIVINFYKYFHSFFRICWNILFKYFATSSKFVEFCVNLLKWFCNLFGDVFSISWMFSYIFWKLAQFLQVFLSTSWKSVQLVGNSFLLFGFFLYFSKFSETIHNLDQIFKYFETVIFTVKLAGETAFRNFLTNKFGNIFLLCFGVKYSFCSNVICSVLFSFLPKFWARERFTKSGIEDSLGPRYSDKYFRRFPEQFQKNPALVIVF